MADTDFTSDLMRSLVAHRYGGDDKRWALFFEMRNGTGFSRSDRYLDVLAMDTWPSSGLLRVAYEIKVSRGDFLRELAQPAKRAWGFEISNQFWFVCAPDVAKPEEIPEGCGLLVATKGGEKLRAVKQAQQRTCRDLDMLEVAAVLRAADNSDAHRSLRWRYANQTVDEKRLDEIISAERPYSDQREIDKKASDLAKERMEHVDGALKNYAEALKKAGIEPPSWMSHARGLSESSWSAELWVRDNLVPGPSVCIVNRTISEMERARNGVDTAIEAVKRLLPTATQENA